MGLKEPKRDRDGDIKKHDIPPEEKLIVILEGATLETVKVKNFELLNVDDHRGILKKAGRDAAEYRPDITHQCLLTLLDSPLNKADRLQVYIHTKTNVLIEVNPSIRIPRTYKRFAGLIVQLLHKLSIRATDGKEKLMRVIPNPIQKHLPVGARIIGLSGDAPLVRVRDYVTSLPSAPIVFVVGSYAHGEDPTSYSEENISLSDFSLSASVVCGKLCCGFEERWSVL